MSPELIRLINGLPFAEPEQCVPELEPSIDTAIAEAPAQEDNAPEPMSADMRADGPCPMPVMKLRIDGARPKQIHASMILETALKQCVTDASGLSSAIQSHLSLYSAEGGEIVAHIAAIPGAGLSARPIHRATVVHALSDLATFVEAATKDACFGTTPPGHFRHGLTLSAPAAGQGGIRLPLGPTNPQDISR